MAIEIKFRGFINDILKFDWGTVYKVSHNQVRKTPSGEWETTGRDYLDVVGPEGFNKDDQVEVVGNLKTRMFDKKDGSGKGIALNVQAKEMSKVERGGATHAQMQQVWPEVRQVGTEKVALIEDGAPF